MLKYYLLLYLQHVQYKYVSGGEQASGISKGTLPALPPTRRARLQTLTNRRSVLGCDLARYTS